MRTLRYFLARLAYRTVSIFFFLGAILMWLCWFAAIALQIWMREFHLSAIWVGIVAPIVGVAMFTSSNEAWRAAQYCHRRYDYA